MKRNGKKRLKSSYGTPLPAGCCLPSSSASSPGRASSSGRGQGEGDEERFEAALDTRPA